MPNLLSKLTWTLVLAVALMGCMLYPMPPQIVVIIQGVLAAIFVLYLPGYWISYLLFANNELSTFERFVMSIAISLALIGFISLYMHYFGIIISMISVYLVALSAIYLAAFCLSIARLRT